MDNDVKTFSQIVNEGEQEKFKMKKGRTILFLAFIFFLVLDVFFFAEYRLRGDKSLGYKVIDSARGIIEQSGEVLSSIWEPEFKHTDDGLTSLLVVGIDARNVESKNGEFINTKPEGQAGTRNTDTIIQIVYDNNSNEVFMISIPRDMGVDVNKDCLEFHGSIQWVYDKAESNNCASGGIQTLSEVVEGITGIPVHYYAFVSLESFIDIIDEIGDTDEKGNKGIWIDNPEVVYEVYPKGEYGWENVYFPEGRQFLTSEQALKYARSRQITSDFGRAKRQQIVINAVKEKIMSSDTYLNPDKLLSLLNIFKKNAIFSIPNVEEIRAGITALEKVNTENIVNIVLTPELGGHEVLINKQPHDRLTAQYYMVPTHWKDCPGDEFCKVKEYLRNVINYPELVNENPKIFVYAVSKNSSGIPNFNNDTYEKLLLSNMPILLTESKYLAKYDTNDVAIIDFSSENEKFAKTLDILSDKLDTEIVDGSKYSFLRINKEDIAIIVKGD